MTAAPNDFPTAVHGLLAPVEIIELADGDSSTPRIAPVAKRDRSDVEVRRFRGGGDAQDPPGRWKDTVLVRTGETVDIPLDVTNPGADANEVAPLRRLAQLRGLVPHLVPDWPDLRGSDVT